MLNNVSMLINWWISICFKGGGVSLQVSWPRAQCRRPSVGRTDWRRECQQCGNGHGDRNGYGYWSRRGWHQRQNPPGGSGNLRQWGGHGQRLHHLQHQPVLHPCPLAIAALLTEGKPFRLLWPRRDGVLLSAHPQRRQSGGRDHQYHHTWHCGGSQAEQPAADAGELGLSWGDTAAQRGLQETSRGEGRLTQM